MPNNPERESRGGDVEGTTPIKVTQGEAIPVAKASFDPGYDTAKSRPDISTTDLRQGFCSGGPSTGEKEKGNY